jgi:CubicO group peptidase (beta-lactamase class C family)
MKINRLGSLLLLVLAASLAAAQPAPRGVDQYVQSELTRQHIPGIALGVYRDGKIVTAKGYGLANVELNVPVKAETIFQSGSIGKQFAATAVMMLVEQGKIDLDGSITRYFPDAPATWQNIKVRNLLSHTSGLAEYESDEKTKPGGPVNMRTDYTEEQFVKMIESFPPEFAPGEKWVYTNSNYVLLGAIIRKVTGKFYGDYLQERIFKPLGMTSTRVISEEDIVPNRAAGYRLVNGELKNQEWVAPLFNTTADGALYFNVLDLSKWDAALYTEKLIRKSSLDQMWMPAKLNNGKVNADGYGFAWFVHSINGHRLIEHGGSWQGFHGHIARYVDDKLTVVVLTNLDSAHSDAALIAHHVAGLYEPALMPKP